MATPLALIRGGGMAAERGILMRSGEAFQILVDITHVVFDKTGIGILLASLALVAAAPPPGEAAEPAQLAAQSLQTVTLEVQNMVCAACPIAVRKALTRVPGVTEAKVDLDTKSAVVTFDPTKTNVEALTKATGDVGFPSRLKR